MASLIVSLLLEAAFKKFCAFKITKRTQAELGPEEKTRQYWTRERTRCRNALVFQPIKLGLEEVIGSHFVFGFFFSSCAWIAYSHKCTQDEKCFGKLGEVERGTGADRNTGGNT